MSIRDTPQQVRPSASPSSHNRSHSSPYFEHTRTFTSDHIISSADFIPNTGPQSATAYVTAIPPSRPGRLQRPNRTSTTDGRPVNGKPVGLTLPRLPLVTTDINIESVPLALPTSLFSGSDPIKFDMSPPESPALQAEKENRWSFMNSFKSDKGSMERSPSPLRISNWFQGESAPVGLGVAASPTKEILDPMPKMSLDAKSILEPLKAAKANTFFSSLFVGKTDVRNNSPGEDDEVYSLDIKKALQPGGQGDAFSPAAYKNLQQNAEGILARMQIAYRQRVHALQEIKAEQEAQDEEIEEAQTRADHLKSQLNSVSTQLAQQDQELRRLKQELEDEKRLRRADAERYRTIRVVGEESPVNRRAHSRASLGSVASTPSMLSDADSSPSEVFDRQDGRSTTSSPYSAESLGWPEEQQYHIPLPNKTGQSGDHSALHEHKILKENAELKSRVGHLEQELEDCLEILKGIGL